MELELLVRNGSRTLVPVTVHANERATVGQLRRALLDTLGGPDLPLANDGVPLPDDRPLSEPGLVRGGIVDLAQRPLPVRGREAAPLEVAVAGGLQAGIPVPLPGGGTVTVGRAHGCDVSVMDSEVSRTHAQLTSEVDSTAVTATDLGSRNGIRMGAWRLTGAARLRPGDVIGLGESVLVVREPLAPGADVRTAPGTGDRLFNRPPRIRPPDTLPELVMPVKPAPPGGFRFPWLTTLLPAVLFGGLYLLLPQGDYAIYLLMMTALSPLMALANLVSDRRSGRKEYSERLAAYELSGAAFQTALEVAVAVEERAERESHPDPARLVRMTGAGTTGPSSALWQRRRAASDFLRLRVGLTDRPARLTVRLDPAAGPIGDLKLPDLPTVRDVPLTVDLADAGVLGVAGPRPSTMAAARALLTQAAALHAPADLGIVLITGRDTAQDWEWASWLPHTEPSSSLFDCARMVATDAAQAQARLAELRRLAEERVAERRGALSAGPPPGRAMLVVLDGARRLRHLPGLAELLAAGPAAGIHALCLDSEETALPDECGASVVATTASGSRARIRRAGLVPVEDVLLDGLLAPAAEAAARALAPLRTLGERASDSALPDRVRFTDLTQLTITGDPAADADAVKAGWRRSPGGRGTTALLGIGPDGPIQVDLRRDGPHALIAGTSGSGKSELLQTLVASLALVNTPDALTFVLVDYKGGSAFAACADLPHCVGLVTDLDGHLVNRALASLSAELRRREALLAEAGAKDIDDYWARTGARLPRLVIVIDEFASLVEEIPEFVPGVVGIGMRGRSLGVHVVLATQRPAGVVTADLRANVNLRISLRVTADSESVDVIEAPDAARIPARHPGRAFLRTGHGELTAFQTARIGWPRTAEAERASQPGVRVAPRRMDTLGRPVREPDTEKSDVDTEGRTDLSDLVAAISRAAADLALTDPPRPWLPALPAEISLTGLDFPSARPGPVAAVLGLVDRPDAQSQDAFLVDLERTGPLVIAGAVRTGRSTALRTLGASLALAGSPADVQIYGLDCGNRALAPLEALPHCGAVVDGEDEQRTDRLLSLLEGDVARRQRRLATHGLGSLAEQRVAAAPEERLPYLVVLLDRLEAFVARYADTDGGRQVDRVERLLRTGPAVGIAVVLATDRTGFGHRIASAVSARLVLRQASPDDAAAFGLDVRSLPGQMPPGRAIVAATGEEVQIALLDPDPSGAAQAAAVHRIAADLSARWDGIAEHRLPRRIDPLPIELSITDVEALRHRPRPAGRSVCTPAVGGDQLAPVDVDLAEAGGTFLVAGPPRSGRSTALLAVVTTLGGREGAELPVLAIAPRPSPLRELSGAPGVLDVLTGSLGEVAARLADVATGGPLAVVVDDAELINEPVLTDALTEFARASRDGGSLLIAAATTEDLLLNRYRGWLAAMRRSRSGLLLNPSSAIDGEVFDLRLARSTAGGWPPGRGLLVVAGVTSPVQVPFAVPTPGWTET